MSGGYIVRARAEADLEEIWWGYTAGRWSVEQAEKYLQNIFAAFGELASEPSRGRRRDDVRPGYFRYPVGAHVNFFVITSGLVDIVRVLHARRDLPQLLPKS